MADHPVWGGESGGVCGGISCDREAGGREALCVQWNDGGADRRQSYDRLSGDGGYDPVQNAGAVITALWHSVLLWGAGAAVSRAA